MDEIEEVIDPGGWISYFKKGTHIRHRIDGPAFISSNKSEF